MTHQYEMALALKPEHSLFSHLALVSVPLGKYLQSLMPTYHEMHRASEMFTVLG